MTFLNLAGTITGPLGANLATLDLGLLPLAATATGAPGTVQCDALDPPVITAPTDGSTTGETPTISGTGIPGATVTVREANGDLVGTAVVAGDGSWSLTPGSPLSLGQHTITATQALGAATSGTSNAVTFTVEDRTAPDAPVIQIPADGSVTNDATPTVSGTGEPGATVEVTVDGVVVGTTTVGPGGNWSLPLTSPLADGPHTVSATQTDAAGNVSPADSNTFTVDTVAPAAPVIDTPADGSVIADATPTVSGTGEAGASVEVRIDGNLLGTTTVGPGGNWSLDVTTPLTEGPHTVTATQTDAAGNTSPADSNAFVVDTVAPDAPVIQSPADGSSTNDATPTISGTGEAGATLVVTVDGTVVGTVIVAPDGSWTVPVTTPLAEGPHTVTARQTDAAGNISPADTNSFSVDTVAPAAPVIDTPADGSVIADATPTVSGTGEAGASVEVRIDGNLIGTTTVGPGGNWSLDVTTPLGDGPHTVTATQTDAAGNTSPADSNAFVVDTVAPDAPVIQSPANGSSTNDTTPTISGTGEAGATLVVTVDGTVVGTVTVAGDGTWTVPVTTPLAEGPHTVGARQTDAAGNVSPADTNTFTVDLTAPAPPVVTSPADGSSTNDTTPPISGTGAPGATVEVTVDGTVVGTATVAPDGTWSLTVPNPLAPGPHTVTATQTDEAGNTSPASAPVTFILDTAAPDAPEISAPTDGSVTGDSTPTISGTGESGATVVVTDQTGRELGTATVGPGGSWSFDSVVLADGDYTITATQTDAAGNVSPASAPVTFTVDTVAPQAPVIQSPAAGSSTNDTTPTISGTGEAGATLVVTVDGTVVGTVTVAGDGTWTVPVTTPLAEGPHTVGARQTDAAGNLSPADTNSFTVDTAVPAAPVIERPADGATTDDTTPTIAGSGEPGATIVVRVDGTPVGTTVVAPDGTWTLQLDTPLADGVHTVTAIQTDRAGNVSPAAALVTFTIAPVSAGAPGTPIPGTPGGGGGAGGGPGQPGDQPGGGGGGVAGAGAGVGGLAATGAPWGLGLWTLLGGLLTVTGAVLLSGPGRRDRSAEPGPSGPRSW